MVSAKNFEGGGNEERRKGRKESPLFMVCLISVTNGVLLSCFRFVCSFVCLFVFSGNKGTSRCQENAAYQHHVCS